MLIVGLTGGIGSGKSTVAALFAKIGAPVIDTDHIARQLTAPGGAALPAITQTFGPAAVESDGSMNRTYMREQVFADAQARQQLEQILHPMIRAAVLQQLTELQTPYALVEIPLLAQSPVFQALVHRILVVDCAESTQIRRVMQRNGWTEEQAATVLAAQSSRQTRLALADDILDNESPPETLAAKAHALHQHYVLLAGLHNCRESATMRRITSMGPS